VYGISYTMYLSELVKLNNIVYDYTSRYVSTISLMHNFNDINYFQIENIVILITFSLNILFFGKWFNRKKVQQII